jgi:hypothetical protein
MKIKRKAVVSLVAAALMITGVSRAARPRR